MYAVAREAEGAGIHVDGRETERKQRNQDIDATEHEQGTSHPDRRQEHETGEKGSGDPSRWDADRELEWFSLRPELVVEVTYDHTSGGRIRHGTG